MNYVVNTSEYLAPNCDEQRVLCLKGCGRKRSDSNKRYQLSSCLKGIDKTTTKPHNSRCPDRDVKRAPLEYKCEKNTASASFGLKGYLKKLLQIPISPNPITFLAFSGHSSLKVNITDSLLVKYFVREL